MVYTARSHTLSPLALLDMPAIELCRLSEGYPCGMPSVALRMQRTVEIRSISLCATNGVLVEVM